jgi:hypothetical protein
MPISITTPFNPLFYEVPREPFELPDLTEGFSPDDLDVKILGKKQEKSVFA